LYGNKDQILSQIKFNIKNIKDINSIVDRLLKLIELTK